jgi:hypothetical protein
VPAGFGLSEGPAFTLLDPMAASAARAGGTVQG